MGGGDGARNPDGGARVCVIQYSDARDVAAHVGATRCASACMYPTPHTKPSQRPCSILIFRRLWRARTPRPGPRSSVKCTPSCSPWCATVCATASSVANSSPATVWSRGVCPRKWGVPDPGARGLARAGGRGPGDGRAAPGASVAVLSEKWLMTWSRSGRRWKGSMPSWPRSSATKRRWRNCVSFCGRRTRVPRGTDRGFPGAELAIPPIAGHRHGQRGAAGHAVRPAGPDGPAVRAQQHPPGPAELGRTCADTVGRVERQWRARVAAGQPARLQRRRGICRGQGRRWGAALSSTPR